MITQIMRQISKQENYAKDNEYIIQIIRYIRKRNMGVYNFCFIKKHLHYMNYRDMNASNNTKASELNLESWKMNWLYESETILVGFYLRSPGN